jgi:hypothetical protein
MKAFKEKPKIILFILQAIPDFSAGGKKVETELISFNFFSIFAN